MKTKIELASWARREHFEFFNQFSEPYHSLVANVDVTRAYAKAKSIGVPLFLHYLHATLTTVNRLENFKYRAEDGEVYLYDPVGVSVTIDRPDGSFGFGNIDYSEELHKFIAYANIEIAKVRASASLFNGPNVGNLIHFSAIPWVHFTGLTHARNFAWKDSIPKISVGKIITGNGRKLMPVSVTVHHGLADGAHVGQFFELFQQLLDRD